jgi:DNA-binding MurR/RpiR family transcriptional regulator
MDKKDSTIVPPGNSTVPDRNPETNEQVGEIEPGNLAGMSEDYLKYLANVTRALTSQEKELENLCSLIRGAGAVHVFGFGRSGTAALAFAIRLRHFCEYLSPVWWVGDQVRMPIRERDLLIVFSKDGSRSELAAVAYQAVQQGAQIAFITAGSNSRVGALARLKIILPLSKMPFVYGGGDFELAAFFFQEVLVTHIGKSRGIPKECVGRNHV